MRYAVMVFLGACSYGILSTFVKLAYGEGFNVGQLVGSQMLFGAMIMWAISAVFGRGRASGREWLLLLGCGTTIGLTGALYYAALQFVPASIAVILLFQFTWIGVLIEAALNRRRPGKEKLWALAVILLGTLLAGGITDLSRIDLRGVGLGLLAAVSYALFIVASGKAATHVRPLFRSAIMTTGSLLLAFLVFPPTFLLDGALFGKLSVWGLLLGLFGPVVPTVLYAAGVPKTGGDLASILGAAELPTAVLMSRFVLHEPVGPLVWTGVAIILAGIVLPGLAAKRKALQASRG